MSISKINLILLILLIILLLSIPVARHIAPPNVVKVAVTGTAGL